MNLRGQRNQCRGCGLYFNSNKAFDKHRIGEFEVDRRCRTPDEMTALGMAQNKKSFWVTKQRPEGFFDKDELDE